MTYNLTTKTKHKVLRLLFGNKIAIFRNEEKSDRGFTFYLFTIIFVFVYNGIIYFSLGNDKLKCYLSEKTNRTSFYLLFCLYVFWKRMKEGNNFMVSLLTFVVFWQLFNLFLCLILDRSYKFKAQHRNLWSCSVQKVVLIGQRERNFFKMFSLIDVAKGKKYKQFLL